MKFCNAYSELKFSPNYFPIAPDKLFVSDEIRFHKQRQEANVSNVIRLDSKRKPNEGKSGTENSTSALVIPFRKKTIFGLNPEEMLIARGEMTFSLIFTLVFCSLFLWTSLNYLIDSRSSDPKGVIAGVFCFFFLCGVWGIGEAVDRSKKKIELFRDSCRKKAKSRGKALRRA